MMEEQSGDRTASVVEFIFNKDITVLPTLWGELDGIDL